MLRSIDDPNYTVGFSDRTEADCLGLQGELTRSVKLSSSSFVCVDFSGLLVWFFGLCIIISCFSVGEIQLMLFIYCNEDPVAFRLN